MRRALITIFSVVGLSLLSVAEASAQIDLGKALGTLLNEAAQTQTTENPYATIKANAPAKSKVLGTWHYLTARVEYLGINSLAQVAIPQLESFVLSELKRNGIVEGCCSLTLNRNGIAVIGTLDSLYEGKYSYDPATAKCKATYIYNNREYAMGGYLKFVQSRLAVLIDMRDILRELLVVRPSLATDENFLMVKGVVDSFGDIYVSVLFSR
jgi:hypothetical protein